MSHLNHQQENALMQLLNDIVDTNTNPTHIKLIQDHDLRDAVVKDGFTETTIEDIEVVAENEDIILTDEQKTMIAHRVMSKYDHSHYNEFISVIINEEIKS